MTIAFGSASSGDCGGSTSDTLTISHTVGNNNNRLLVVGVGYRGANVTVSGVTFDGDALTQLDRVENATAETAVDLWYRKEPAVTTANIVVTMSGVVWCMAGGIDFYNVHQGTPFGTQAKDASVSTLSTINVTSAVTELVVDIVAKKYTDSTDGLYVVGADQTSRLTDKSTSGTDSNNIYGAMSTEVGSATTTMSWGWTAGNRFKAQIAVPIKPSSLLPPRIMFFT